MKRDPHIVVHRFFNKLIGKKGCIESVPIFSQLTDKEIDEVLKVAISRKFGKGDIIFSPGEISEDLFIVYKGKVKISRISASGKEQILRILEPGDFTGELSLFGQSPSKNMAEALEKTVVCLVRGQEIKQLVLKAPNIALKILEEYTQRFERLENVIEQFGLHDVEQRVAGILLQLAAKHTGETENGVDITLSISKGDLASLIGTTQESLSRKLSAFQEQGWIKLIGQRRILILDQDSLRRIISS
ncbi:Crp/Fnr family transcriptional regulator [Brevibacillus sp. SYSU BS000544]|uniref:Crp/Fnr family transcriptional regulator n=1 Tax=Brevibacillus sp. SYSU BS000544 TaxID=3416443 RepID=UPI003CE50B4B